MSINKSTPLKDEYIGRGAALLGLFLPYNTSGAGNKWDRIR